MQIRLLTNFAPSPLTLVSDPTEIVRERLRGRIRTLRGDSAGYSTYGIWSIVDSFSAFLRVGLRPYGFPLYSVHLFFYGKKALLYHTARLFAQNIRLQSENVTAFAA